MPTWSKEKLLTAHQSRLAHLEQINPNQASDFLSTKFLCDIGTEANQIQSASKEINAQIQALENCEENHPPAAGPAFAVKGVTDSNDEDFDPSENDDLDEDYNVQNVPR
jgi:hypothetical protein